MLVSVGFLKYSNNKLRDYSFLNLMLLRWSEMFFKKKIERKQSFIEYEKKSAGANR